MARRDAMTMKIDAQYKEMNSRKECNHCEGNHSTADCNDDDIPMSSGEEGKIMQTFRCTRVYNDYRDRDSDRNNWRLNAVIRVKQKQLDLRVGFKRMVFSIDSTMKHSYSKYDTCFSIDVIDEIIEEDFEALLDEDSKIPYSIEGTPLEDKIFVEFDEFIAMNIEGDTEPEINEK
nr:reverse transcriptase domain-containing protein [Tanacetum cinerariifolium]